MKVRLLELKDIERVNEIIDMAKAYFKSCGSPQWQNGYPNKETLASDLELGVGYVLEDEGCVVGYAAIILDDDPNYSYIEQGKWIYDEPYGVMHRICIDNSYKGKGYAHELFKKFESLCLEHHRYVMRIDTHELNTSMQHLISKEEFTYCGIVYMEDHSPRLAYEKKLVK